MHVYVRRSPEERFWAKVDKSGDCWLWTGQRVRNGYGHFFIERGRSSVKAHRFSYELANGPVPARLLVLHRCDNPPCVRPDHLYAGTPQDNMDDKMSRGRAGFAHGEQLPHSILTDAQIREIRRRYRPRVVTLEALANEYGTSVTNVSNIIHRKRWAHVE